MCGIVGLLIKNPLMRAQLGELLMPMMLGMTQRGPDSAGLAVYTERAQDALKYSLFCDVDGFSWERLGQDCEAHFGKKTALVIQGQHVVLSCDLAPDLFKQWLSAHAPQVIFLSAGHSIELYKDIGTPAEVAERYQFGKLQGSHAIGHTRMATESAVTPNRAHPFTAGEDFCLVHNGSLSNAHDLRRKLEPQGIHFDTDNDTEAACRFLEWRMREGDDLSAAITHGFDALDGFYTFLIGTENAMALVRDPFACKPAVVAETDDYVAIASEFHALAHLPNVKNATIYEPAPKEIYIWTV
jgi:glutamate synthase domain-containing protein 1